MKKIVFIAMLVTVFVATNRVTELEFQRDAGLLEINANGLWKEYPPEETENVNN